MTNVIKKVLFIFPRMKYRSGDPPLGVAYLASVLCGCGGVDVKIADTTFSDAQMEELAEILSRESFDFVGISVMTL